MSDNFDRKVCDGLQSTKNPTVTRQYLHNYQYFVEQLPSNASFCSVCGCKKVALTIKEKTLKQNMSE